MFLSYFTISGKEHKDSSEESSDTVTFEVVRQVRTRLQELERESEALDQKFKKFLLK